MTQTESGFGRHFNRCSSESLSQKFVKTTTFYYYPDLAITHTTTATRASAATITIYPYARAFLGTKKASF